jgi:predicted ATPase
VSGNAAMARLDRLGSAKEIAQVGASIGGEFSHALLSNRGEQKRMARDRK